MRFPVSDTFGDDIDYAQLQKFYGADPAGWLRGRWSIAERAGLAAISADPEVMRLRPIQQHHCSLCAARCPVIQSTPSGAGGRHGCWPRGLPCLVIRARPALHLAEPLGISARDDAVEPAFTMKIAQRGRDVAARIRLGGGTAGQRPGCVP
jgi:hypothetical protein